MNIVMVVFCLLYVSYELFSLFHHEELRAVTNTKTKLDSLNVLPKEYYSILIRKFGKAFIIYLTLINMAYMIFCIMTLFTKYLYVGLVLISLAILEQKIFNFKNQAFKILDSVICIMILCFAIYQALGVR